VVPDREYIQNNEVAVEVEESEAGGEVKVVWWAEVAAPSAEDRRALTLYGSRNIEREG